MAETVPGRSYAETISLFNARFDPPITQIKLENYIRMNRLSTGRTGRFQKGQPNPYKGKPRPPHWKRPMTGIKNGMEYQMYKPIGSTRKTKGGYVEVKAADSRRWKLLHRLVWEKEHGPVPSGHVVIFGDGNKSNVCLENLLLVSRAQLAMLNKFNLLGKSSEITKTGIIAANLRLKMAKLSKMAKGEFKNTVDK